MLEFKDVSLKYTDEMVLDKVSMKFEPGTVTVISGNSGCGKSSVIKLINGVIPHFSRADFSGKILLGGQNIYTESIAGRSRHISTVFQNPKSQFFSVNSYDEIAFALENRNVPSEEIINKIAVYSKLLATENLLGKNIFMLSGGQRQMVAITGVVVMDGLVYIFDEPSSSLDSDAIEQFKDIIAKLKEMGKIIVIAEHRLYFLKGIMDKLYILNNGQVDEIEVGNLREEKLKSYNLRSLEKTEKSSLKDGDHCYFVTKSLREKKQESGILRMDNYKYSYRGGNPVFDMNFSLNRGINFIIGENGIGKTTFIRCLCGLNKKFKGKTYYNGDRLKRSSDYISLVMQDVNYQLYTESVWEEVSLVSGDSEEKEGVLKCLNLIDKKEAHPQSLSGGEKQRLLIANAILSEKPIVILDEPTSGLCKKQMISIVKYLHKMEREGKTVIVVTHDYEFIKACGGRIYEFV